jgi:hypothetical protein
MRTTNVPLYLEDGTIANIWPYLVGDRIRLPSGLDAGGPTLLVIDTHLKHSAANYSSAVVHLYTDDTGTRKGSGQLTPRKTSSIIGPLYPVQQGTQSFTHSVTSEAV